MQAFKRCVTVGVNVIDTAINYRYERAEQCLGRALAKQIDAGTVARDEIILCTKGGYLPHPDRARWFEAEIVGPSGGAVSMDDLVGGSHCMHPDYIEGLASTIMAGASAFGPMPFGLARDLMGSYTAVLTWFALLPLVLAVAAFLFGQRPHKAEKG